MNKILYIGSNFDLTNGIDQEYLDVYSDAGIYGFKCSLSKETANNASINNEKSPYFRGENVTPVKLKFENPIYIDKNNESQSIPLTKNQIKNIIQELPKEQIINILNDYYGEVKYEGYNKLFNLAISSYQSEDINYILKTLRNDFFSNYNEQDYLEIIKKHTQYDAIVKQEYNGDVNVFVFSNTQIYSAIDNMPLCKQNNYNTKQDIKLKENLEETENSSQMEELIKEISKYKTYEELKKDVLYHGTSEDIIGELKGGGYDNIVWAADDNTVAQNYISLSGSSSYYYAPTGYELNRIANVFQGENSFDIKVLKKFGYDFKFEKDLNGDIFSVSCTLNGREAKLPKKKTVYDLLINRLGYKKQSTYIKIKFDKEGDIAPESYKKQGRLYVFLGKTKLKIEDKSVGYFNNDNPAYHNLKGFKDSENKGYDAVIIDDATQSDNHGNVEHLGYALFESALEKLTSYYIPATNFDWEDDFNIEKTSDFDLKEIFDESRKLLKNKKKSIKIKS